MSSSKELQTPFIVRQAFEGQDEKREYWIRLYQEAPLEELLEAAKIVTAGKAPQKIELCSIENVQNRGCSEDCIFCAQSSRWNTLSKASPLRNEEKIMERAQNLEKAGVRSFSLVASGKIQEEEDFQRFCALFRRLRKETGLSLCASLGFLSPPRALELKQAGVTRYHNNLESCADFFPRLCSTHGQKEKRATLKIAAEAGLSLCSGGIIGLGETPVHRIDLALELRKLKISSIPLNVLMPIPGTPLGKNPLLAPEEILRTLALFRFILPQSRIRLGGGRKALGTGLSQALLCGANGLMTGDYLTTTGSNVQSDLALITSLNLEILS